MGAQTSQPRPRGRSRASRTQANTLANRSPTPVARHVALARLADRLASLRGARRRRVIEGLRLPSEVLREVERYAAFDAGAGAGDGIESEVESPAASADGAGRKGVSFAKFAELRRFRQ